MQTKTKLNQGVDKLLSVFDCPQTNSIKTVHAVDLAVNHAITYAVDHGVDHAVDHPKNITKHTQT